MKRRRKTNKISTALILFSMALISSCGDGGGDFLPKPKGLNHIILPEPSYQLLKDSSEGFPYSFEYSAHAQAINDTSNWKNRKLFYKIIDYPEFQSKIHITYKPIGNNLDSLNSYINESYRLLEGHDKKTYGRDARVDTINGNVVYFFELEGEVPSPYQFFTHDSTNHFLRGALYFNTSQKNDSLRPVINFVKADADRMMHTLKWN